MDTWIWIVVAVVVVALVVAAVLAWQAARRKRLQETFGPVYEREVESASSRREAEAELEDNEIVGSPGGIDTYSDATIEHR